MLISCIVVLLFSSVLISKTASSLIKSIIPIGHYLHISEFGISFILMAFATSLPELFVALLSAAQNESNLALGTAIGSNIADLTLVVGISAIAAGNLRIKSLIKKRDIVYMGAISIILILLLMDGTLSRPDSMILLMIYAYYMYRIFRQKEKFESKIQDITKQDFFKNIAVFAISVVVLITCAQLIVWSVKQISEYINISITLLGIVVVAVGTSIPELSFEIAAIKSKHQDMVMGDVIGSVVTNAALILGLVGLLFPVEQVELSLINTSLITLAVITVVVLYFVRNDSKLTWKEGVILCFIYLIFLSVEYLVKFL